MGKNRDTWTLTNMSKEVREIARACAHAEGQTLSGWLTALIKSNHRETDIKVLIELIENSLDAREAHRQERRGLFGWRKK